MSVVVPMARVCPWWVVLNAIGTFVIRVPVITRTMRPPRTMTMITTLNFVLAVTTCIACQWCGRNFIAIIACDMLLHNRAPLSIIVPFAIGARVAKRCVVARAFARHPSLVLAITRHAWRLCHRWMVLQTRRFIVKFACNALEMVRKCIIVFIVIGPFVPGTKSKMPKMTMVVVVEIQVGELLNLFDAIRVFSRSDAKMGKDAKRNDSTTRCGRRKASWPPQTKQLRMKSVWTCFCDKCSKQPQ